MQPPNARSPFAAILCRGLFLLLLPLFLAGCSEEGKQARLLERADKFAEAGDYEAAQIEYRNVLQSDPENARAIAQLGFIWMEEGAPLRAAPFLLHTRDNSPDDTGSRIKLAFAYRALGRTAEAQVEAKAVLEKDPDHEEAILLLGETAHTPEDMQALRSHLQQLAAGGEAPLGYHLGSAFLAIRGTDFTAAEDHLQKALGVDPDSFRAHMAIANIREIQGDDTEAETSLKRAAELSPVRSHARMRLADFYLRKREFDKAQEVLKGIKEKAPGFLPASNFLARLALAQGDFARAISESNDALTRDATNYDARLLKSQALLGNGEAAKAVGMLERLDTDYPNLSFTKFHLARAYLGEGKGSQAMSALDAAIQMNPGFVEAVLLQGELHLRSGDPAAAVTSMKALVEKKPDSTAARMLLASAYSALGQFEEALAIYRAYSRAAPSDARPHYLMGVIERQRGRTAEARQAFLQAEELDPGSLAVAARLVEMDLAEKEVAAAQERTDRLLARESGSAPAHYLKASIHATQEEWDQAEEVLKKCIALDGNYGRAYDLLISIYMKTGELEEARGRMDEVLAKNPGNVTALLLAATIQQQLGDDEAARRSYESVLAIKPDAAVAQNNLAFLYVEEFDQPGKAYELATKARAANPEDAAIADTLGWVLFRRGEYRKALTLLEESRAKAPGQPEIESHLGQARYMMGLPGKARAALEVATASENEFRGKEAARARLDLLVKLQSEPAPTMAELQEMSAQQPDDIVVLLALAERYEGGDQAAKAAETCARALAANPDLLLAHTILARLHAGPLDDAKKALEHARQARALAPGDPAVAASLGGIALQTGSADWAYSLLQESNREHPGNATVLVNLARAAYRTGRLAEAKTSMQKAWESAPSGPLAGEARGFLDMLALQFEVADLPAAKAAIGTVLRADPMHLPALMARAATHRAEGKSEEAGAAYRQILAEFRGFPLAQIELARVLARTGEAADLAAAGELVKEARRNLPGNTRAVVTLAEIAYRDEDNDYAIRLLREVDTRKALPPEGLAILGLAQVASEQEAAGKASLQRALDAGLQGPLLDPARKALEQ